jgi:hypothetical protein
MMSGELDCTYQQSTFHAMDDQRRTRTALKMNPQKLKIAKVGGAANSYRITSFPFGARKSTQLMLCERRSTHPL